MEKYKIMLLGGVRLRITGAQPQQVLNRCVSDGLRLDRAVPEGAFSLILTVRPREVNAVKRASQKCLCAVEELAYMGLPYVLKRLRRRYALLLMPILLLLLLVWSQLHVWHITVTGNASVSTGEILCALDRAGVSVGSFWPTFVSDSIRSRVMVQIPELRWLTVNIHGSHAQVIVRERVQAPELRREAEAVHVVADRAGLITETRIYWGSAQVKPGQTVAAGDILSAGALEDLSGFVRTEHAYADVWARTWYENTAAAPLIEQRKTASEQTEDRYSAAFGEMRINFYQNSGKNGGECGKIYSERRVGVDGLFSLPLVLIRDSRIPYTLESVQLNQDTVSQRLRQELTDELSSSIGEDGRILSQHFVECVQENMLYVTMLAECEENIACERAMTAAELEQIEISNAQNAADREEETE